MLTYIARRLLISIPTLIFISLVIFLLLNLAPNDPMAQVPLTVPPEVKQKMREALGLGQKAEKKRNKGKKKSET
jgi:peptide/nickel transport system permease protein